MESRAEAFNALIEGESSAEKTARINARILADRQRKYDKHEGPRVGDFVVRPGDDGKPVYDRITYIWPSYEHEGETYSQVQCGGCRRHGGYYLGNGYQSYSGGLNGGCRDIDLEPTDETVDASVWFFNRDDACAHNGAYFEATQRVYKLKPGANFDKH